MRPFPSVSERGTRPAIDRHGQCLPRDALYSPMIGINSLPAANHQPEFTAHCITPNADKALIDGALAMAWTYIDLATHPTLRDRLLAHH